MSERRPRAKRAFWPPFAKRDDNGGSDRAIARADKPCASVDKSRSAVWTNERPRHAFRLGSEGGRQRTKSAMRERTQKGLSRAGSALASLAPSDACDASASTA
jgi:hypothetical protein